MGTSNETKPAFQTTEFWATAVVTLVSLLQLSGVWQYASDSKNPTVMAVMAGAIAVYGLARGIAKKGVPYDPNAGK